MAKSIPQNAKTPSKKSEQKDKFGLYVILCVMLLLICYVSYYFYTHQSTRTDSTKDYLSLPEMVIAHDDQSVKLEITIQVDERDHDWLEKNQSAINEIYQVTVQKFDPNMFRSKDGCEEIQRQLRDTINKQMNVSKIKAVYFKNLLVQHKE
jgi:flagellar basal body-associated protein FliL